jgi:hypothetical protein
MTLQYIVLPLQGLADINGFVEECRQTAWVPELAGIMDSKSHVNWCFTKW